MEDIDNFTDDQLRRRLAEYGFANLPVTDTTRKVLVKKLKNAITNESAKNRRETVAVSKFSSDEEPDKGDSVKNRGAKTPNRRATVAVTEKSSVKKVNGTLSTTTTIGRAETPVKTPSRRASRATPAKQEAVVLQEDSDDDIIEVPVKRRSTSRTTTPTLGKSDTVRTSYKNSVDVVAENEDESIEEIEEKLPPPRKPSPVVTQFASRRKTFTTSTTSYTSNLPEKSLNFPEKSNFSIPSISNSYTRRQTYNFSQPEDDEPLDLDESNTPYLSSFAKRLSTLRAEPLDSGMDKYKELRETGTSSSGYKSSYAPPSYSYKTQAAPAPRKTGLMRSLGQIFDSLDRQYNFRNILYIILIVMIIVAIYVIFFM